MLNRFASKVIVELASTSNVLASISIGTSCAVPIVIEFVESKLNIPPASTSNLLAAFKSINVSESKSK